MTNNYRVEQIAPTRWFLYFENTNAVGEKLLIELTKCIDDKDWKNSLPKIWYKNGYTSKLMDSYWSIETYVYDTEGNCYGRYNPQSKLSEDRKRNVINFDWLLDSTEENKQKLIDEVLRLFNSATGETATEKKIRKVYEFAESHNAKVYESIPVGWKDNGGYTAPSGSTWISNGLPIKQGRETALLLV